MTLDRWRRLLPGLWLGWLLCVAIVATPAAFALLERAEAGRLAARVLAWEAHSALLFGAVLLALERVRARRLAEAGSSSQFSLGLGLAAGALFCTVAGYYGLQQPMAAARAGQGTLSFGQLHAVSAGFYGVKVLLVAALAWRATAAPTAPTVSPGPSS
ncbi:MAG: DUF4149 domain-containing protein [Betaproteobacteria bacterium]|jgi:hypothetical protein